MIQKIHKLSFDQTDEFELVGIVSTENDYKLSWVLNQVFDIQLVKSSSIEIISNKHPVTLFFSCYQFYDEGNMIQYHLILNKGIEGFFLDEYKNIDYFLKISGEIDHFDTDSTMTKIKDSNGILTAIKIDLETLKKDSLKRLNIE